MAYRFGMAPIPASTRRAEEARLAEMLDGRIPLDALVLRRGNMVAIAWAGMSYALCLVRRGRGPTLATAFAACPLEAGEILRRLDGPGPLPDDDWRRIGLGGDMDWHRARPADASDPRRAKGRREALLRLARGTDAARAMLSDDTDMAEPDRSCFLDSGLPDADIIHALVRGHPWVVRQAMSAGGIFEVLRRDGPDAAAAYALTEHGGIGDADAARILDRMRRFRGTRLRGLPEFRATCRALASVPDDLLPPPLPEGAHLDRAAIAEPLAAWLVLPVAEPLARVSGRDVRSVVGKVDAWKPYLDRLIARAGCSPHVTAEIEYAVRAVSREIADMATAMADQVVAPAILATGASWKPPRSGSTGSVPDLALPAAGPAARGALRLLLGNGTLPALAETSRRWHATSNAIDRELASLRGDSVPAGPRAFGDVDLDDGTYMTCLATARELLDEGSPGPDSSGVPGLHHCVGGYGDMVAHGDTCIVSVRRRLPCGCFERLSTAQVEFIPRTRPRVVQHRGHRNAPVPATSQDALRAGLDRVSDAALAALKAHVPPDAPVETVPEFVHRSGSWERMRDLWAFALTRPQRSMGPDELLREAGVVLRTPRAKAGT